MSKTAFLFPGQGAQAVGMAGEFLADNPLGAELFERAAKILGFDLLQLCEEGPADRLNATDVSQPALFVTSLAAIEKMKLLKPDVVEGCGAAAGLSLGEYTALVFAGVMSFEDGLKVVQQRGQAMQAAAEANPSGMVSVLGMDLDKVEAVCERARGDNDVLRVANLLCPGNIVLSGSLEACARANEIATAEGAMKVIPLAVAGAFHTSLMDSAVEKLKAALEGVSMQPPRIAFYSNVDAKTHTDPEEIRELLVKQVVSPVLWESSMNEMIESGCEQFYEVGPGRVLRGLLKRINRKLPCEGVL